MRGEARRESMIAYLTRCETATVEELAEELRVSKMTIHRDLDLLAQQRLVRKLRGGATMQPSVLFESDYRYRRRKNRDLKCRLAEAAADYIEPGMALALDDSTTVGQLAPLLLQKRPLTLLTNSLALMSEFSEVDEISLISAGGVYDKTSGAFIGQVAEKSIGSLWVDLLIMSVPAVRNGVAFFHNPDLARTKRAMLEIASKKIVLFDASKLEKTALHRFGHLSVFDEVLVAGAVPNEVRVELADAGVKLTMVEGGDEGLAPPQVKAVARA
ncbi:MAG: DeoR/GlpR family DNA-binding transcription regulator [Kiloniellales bacterium]|nr:DeoR/GlpR family DNA-binding transcription regulator [Kiloniellales bacterium]